jgi:L-ascorbate metabolism protein UlaG (beta-lactamase superfamily)
MSDTEVYLKPNVLLEPLFNQWYAWSWLMYPPTAAMCIANSHLKIMQSFVANPQIHVNALKNPAMIGGPFINYPASASGDIKALMLKTSDRQLHMMRLAEAIKTLDELLMNKADGTSLEPLYQEVPDMLKGYVELTYDLNNQPSFRFIEGLMYKSPFYDTLSQSIVLSLLKGDDRSFVFSTPRLKSDDQICIDIAFSDNRLDELFKMRSTPRPYSDIKEMLNIRVADDKLFSTLFTERAPRQRDDYAGDGVRIRYFGHACLLIESSETSILTDPIVSYACEGEMCRYDFADLPDSIDYVLITHNHQDHCMFETLLQLRHKVKNIIVPKSGGGLVDPSLKLILQNIGFNNVREIDEMEAIPVAGGFITGLPFLGEHADLNIRTKIAYLVELKSKSIMCAADSNNIEPRMYDHIHQITRDIDILFLGMECAGAPLSWIYGPLLTKPMSRKLDQSRRLNGSDYERGIKIIDRLNPKEVYVYAMGQEPWLTHVTSIKYTEESQPIVESDKLIGDCKGRGLVAERLLGQKEIHLA